MMLERGPRRTDMNIAIEPRLNRSERSMRVFLKHETDGSDHLKKTFTQSAEFAVFFRAEKMKNKVKKKI